MLSVSREDRGAYTCRAYSIQGEAVHTTRLLVQGEIFHLSPLRPILSRWQPRGAGNGLRGGNSVGCGAAPKGPASLAGSASCRLPCGSASRL